MKIYELMLEQDQTLEIEKVGPDETILVDPQTKIKTVVPKDPNKPGMIKPNERGEFELNSKENGEVDQGIKVGDKVKVKM